MESTEEAYWRGFIDKCAELGVDPEELLKQAGIGSALTGAVTSGAKGAWDVVLQAIKKLGGTAAGKGVRQFGRGVSDPFVGMARGLIGKGHWAMEGTPLTSPYAVLRRAGGLPRAIGAGTGRAAQVGLVLKGLSSLFGGGGEPEPEPSAMARVPSKLKDWYEQLRGAVAGE